MKQSISVFLLIKSMTKEEKRHFKLSMSKYKSSKDYMRLFDVMDGQKDYDENKIHEKFKGEPYFKRLASVKAYLHSQIMKSLRNFHEDVSCEVKLNNYLIDIEIQYRKELFEDCLVTIKKSKALAEKYEKLPQLLRTLIWEERIADQMNDLKKIGSLKDTVIMEEKKAFDKYSEFMQLNHLYLESRHKIQSMGAAKTDEEMKLHNNMLAQPIMSVKAKTFQSEHLRLALVLHYTQFKRDFKGAYQALEQILQLFEAYPQHIEEELNSYIGALFSLANISMEIGKLNKTQGLLRKIKNLLEHYPGKAYFKHKLELMELEIDLLLNQGRMPEAAKLLPGLLSFAEINLKRLEPIEKLLLYNIASDTYFAAKDYANAQEFLQKIINFPDQDVRTDLQYHARLTYLILQYEQKEYHHLSYVLRSTYRHLLKRKRVYKLETIVIDFLKTAATLNSERQMLKAFANLKQQLLPLLDEPFERNFLIAFPLIEWIESKLQKKDVAEIIREKYLTAMDNS